MSEYPQDGRTGAWAIIAPERGRRPHDTQGTAKPGQAAPSYDPACPFCPGNEHMLPGIIAEKRVQGSPGRSQRVIPNKYPALRSDVGLLPADMTVGTALPSFGKHEVVIETPRHDLDLCGLVARDVDALMQTYRDRCHVLSNQPGIKSVTLFRIRGRSAGASLSHPHAQIIATGIVPPRHAASAEWARAWHARTGNCPTCEMLDIELAIGCRIIEMIQLFAAFVLFAAVSGCEVVIVPRRHRPSFAQADSNELAQLGVLLQRVVRRLDAVLDLQPYNCIFETGVEPIIETSSFHWCVRILPSLATPGGFELFSGIPINPSLPEDDAAALRAVTVSESAGRVTPLDDP